MSAPPTGWVTVPDVEQRERELVLLLGEWCVIVPRALDDAEALHRALATLARPVLERTAGLVVRALAPKRRGDVDALRSKDQHAKAAKLADEILPKLAREALAPLDASITIGLDARSTIRPRRYAWAKTCDYCERHPNIPPPFHQEVHSDGRGITMRLLPADVMHLRRCEVCGDTFVAGSRTALYCRDACKAAASRARRRGEPARVPAPLLSAEDREAIRLHTEAWAAQVTEQVAQRPLEAPGPEAFGPPPAWFGVEPRSRAA